MFLALAATFLYIHPTKVAAKKHITILFCFNEFASTVQVKHKWYINSWLHLAMFFLLQLSISTHVYFARNGANIIFPFNSWLSFQLLCRLLWG